MKTALVVSLKTQEKIWIGDTEVVVKLIKPKKVELLFLADSSVKIIRDKLLSKTEGDIDDADSDS
jgi:sRNA-binding carbon storage regulator CsrA